MANKTKNAEVCDSFLQSVSQSVISPPTQLILFYSENSGHSKANSQNVVVKKFKTY